MEDGGLTQTLEMVRRLTHLEKLVVLHDLAVDLQKESVRPEGRGGEPFPLIHLATWPEDLPVHRTDLYDDRSR